MVKIGKLVQKLENLFFQNEIPRKMVKQITSPKEPLPLKINLILRKSLQFPHSDTPSYFLRPALSMGARRAAESTLSALLHPTPEHGSSTSRRRYAECLVASNPRAWELDKPPKVRGVA
jgi:hypothetical protein